MVLISLSLVAGCHAGAGAIDGGPSCWPSSYALCVIEGLPPPFDPWHCTDGAPRGRAWCAVCAPVQSDYCEVDGAPEPVVCVPSCAECQPPELAPCWPEGERPAWDAPDLAGAPI